MSVAALVKSALIVMMLSQLANGDQNMLATRMQLASANPMENVAGARPPNLNNVLPMQEIVMDHAMLEDVQAKFVVIKKA